MSSIRGRARKIVAAGLIALLPALAAAASPEKRVRHVFIVTLENKDYADTFGSSRQDPYLVGTLEPMGALLTHYFGTGHVSLDNYVSMLSGQGASAETEADCPVFADFHLERLTPEGLAVGKGCVYPSRIHTLADQLTTAGFRWRGYMEDMGNDPAREAATCGHPPLDARDRTQAAEAPSSAVPAGDQYASRHDPFIYFHSLLDAPDCAEHVVALPRLEEDLATLATTPNFVFITPNLCHDGHDGDGTGAPGKGCVNGEPGGLKSADDFLRSWVPRILASEAYRRDGLLIITFDESSYTSVASTKDPDSGKTTIDVTFRGESCCGQRPGPNITRPVTHVIPLGLNAAYRLRLEGLGGGRVGAVLLSPFIRPGTVSDVPYNHYSLLKSLEDSFGLRHLGFAGQPGLVPFGPDVYTAP
jgi:hypothetical protein